MSLLFEDLFKRLNSDLKRQADAVLSKANRATQVCVCVRVGADLHNSREGCFASGLRGARKCTLRASQHTGCCDLGLWQQGPVCCTHMHIKLSMQASTHPRPDVRVSPCWVCCSAPQLL